MSKYRNRKVIYNGIKFDSVAEAERYKTLCLMEKAGEIDRLELQPKYRLLESQKFEDMDNARPLDYKADFRYREIKTGRIIVEDVKGVMTEAYKIKRKLFKKLYHDTVVFREVKSGK